MRRLDNYSGVHSLAHRRGAPPTGVPALTRLLVLTCDRKDYDAFLGQQSQPAANHHHRAFDFLEFQAHEIQKTFVYICENLEIPEAAIRFERSAYSIYAIGDMFLTIAVDRYRDYLSVQFILDINPDKSSSKFYSEFSVNDTLFPLFFEKYRENSASRTNSKVLECIEILSGNRKSGTDDARQYLYEKIWSLIDEVICFDFDEQNLKLKWITDYRGCVLSARTSSAILNHTLPVPAAERQSQAADQFKKQPFRTLRRLIGDTQSRQREIVCFSIFRGSAIYMSHLGAPMSNTTANSGGLADADFTAFAAIALPGRRWQTGRLIYRMNQIGAFRLMALKDYDEFLHAGEDAKAILSDLERLSAIEYSEDKLSAKLTNLKALKIRIDRLGHGGIYELKYKIRRSRNSTDRFRQTVQTMDLNRIEGWQSYDDFVIRRLNPVFLHVATIDDRLNLLQSSYHATLSELDNELQRESGQHLVQIQDEILTSHTFQHKIESIALAYYGGTLVYYISFGACVYFYKNPIFDIPIFDIKYFGSAYVETTEKNMKTLSFSTMTIFAFFYYKYQEWKHHKKTKARNERRKAIRKGETVETTPVRLGIWTYIGEKVLLRG